jgi:hypothetical protein
MRKNWLTQSSSIRIAAQSRHYDGKKGMAHPGLKAKCIPSSQGSPMQLCEMELLNIAGAQ